MPEEHGDGDRDEMNLKMARVFARSVPHNRALGIRIIEVTPAGATFELPYDPKLVGNPDTGTLHGGAITALLDGCSGAAVFFALTELVPIATLDLRIDYLKPAEPGKSVISKASCYKLTRNVAFTRAVAYQDDPDDAIAHSVGTFMLATRLGKV
ncbi:MAG TPA: PaaI family thioesterase [Kofleriaceae bacterium]|nr:PaaI family thioesterase [Kofleriaceae bacterium]